MSQEKIKVKVYSRYPLSSILTYNGATVLHFVLGGIGIILGYNFLSWFGYLLGTLYLVFAFVEMYVVMPFVVCPNCVYYRMKDSLCISGLNVISKRIAKEGNLEDFPRRAKGIFSHNKMYMGALFAPIVVMIPGLVLNFSLLLLIIFLAVVGLVLFRFFIIFPKVACVHCSAKHRCPNAQAMGLSNT